MLNINEVDDRDWSGLMWAVVNNHINIVKQLLLKDQTLSKSHAGNGSVNGSMIHNINENIKEGQRQNDFDEIFKKPLNPANYGKYNALHWACYKGSISSTSLLLKFGHDPLEIDMYGNSAIHQAAASNNLELFKVLMGLGIDLEVKNSRNHMPGELTSNKEIKNLISRTLSIKSCQICNKVFDFFTKRYLCNINNEVICKNCCESDYHYENTSSEEKEIIDCRCKNCFIRIRETENNMRQALKTNTLKEIIDSLNFSNTHNIKICPRLHKETELEIDRLSREKAIYGHLDNLKVVDNHKTIEKSVYVLEMMIKEAKANRIDLATDIVEKATLEKNRLLAEKELRKMLSNLTVEQSSPENLEILNEKINNAKTCGVDDSYNEIGVELSKKIQLNLSTKELFDLLSAYPIREYPKVEEVDPKKKSRNYL